jgi:hypothetical protein
VRIQARGGPQIDLTGIVDSGAGRTVLSIEVAEELGLHSSDLREDTGIVVADGSTVPCLIPTLPIRGMVLVSTPSDPDLRPWGKIFEIDAVFLQRITSPLWGETDFFQNFKITFERYLNPQTFTLSY